MAKSAQVWHASTAQVVNPATPRPNLLTELKSYRPKFSHLLWLLFIVPLVPHLAEFFSHSWQVLGWEWQIDYDEGFNLSAAWKLANGTNIYAQPTPQRFIGAPYPPLYYLVCALFLKSSGVSMLGGRLISFIATILIGLVLGLISYKFSRSYFKVSRFNAGAGGILAGLIWLALNPTQIWGTFYKQDMFAIALATVGLWLVWRWEEQTYPKKLMYLAAGVLALGFYAKQVELAACGAAVLYLALKDWRVSLRFGKWLVLFLVVPFVVLDILTRHRLYFNTFDAQQVPWIFEDFWRRLSTRILPDHLALIGLALGFVIVEVVRAAGQWRQKRWYAPSLVVVWLASGTFTLITVGSYQSGYNHALGFFPPLIVASSGVLAWLVEAGGQHNLLKRPVWLVAGGAAVVLGWQFISYPPANLYFSFGGMPSQNHANMFSGLVRQINESPGDILSEDIYLQLKTGRPVVYDDLYHMALQAAEGDWDESQFLADLRARRFSVVLKGLGARRFTEAGWQAFLANYSLIFPDGLELWRPRAVPLLPQHEYSCSVGGAIKFNGVSYTFNQASPTLRVTSYWQTGQAISENYTLFIHVIDKNGKLIAQRDETPSGWRSPKAGAEWAGMDAQPLPTNRWQVGEVLAIDQSLPLPTGFDPAAGYRLEVGVYSVKTDGSLNLLASTCQKPSGISGGAIGLPPFD